MANVHKVGAKKMRVEKGTAFTGVLYAMDEPRESNGMPPILVTVASPFSPDAKETQYRTELTEQEMLDTVAEWMKALARNKREATDRLTKARQRAETSG